VQLDPAFAATPRSAAEPASREAVLDLVKLAKRDLEANWDEALKWPSSEGLRDWLALNGSTRRRG
jgi:hypothetical protein